MDKLTDTKKNAHTISNEIDWLDAYIVNLGDHAPAGRRLLAAAELCEQQREHAEVAREAAEAVEDDQGLVVVGFIVVIGLFCGRLRRRRQRLAVPVRVARGRVAPPLEAEDAREEEEHQEARNEGEHHVQ